MGRALTFMSSAEYSSRMKRIAVRRRSRTAIQDEVRAGAVASGTGGVAGDRASKSGEIFTAYDLDALLARVRRGRRQPEVASGLARGDEVW